MARVSGFWKRIGDTIEPAFQGGASLLLRGVDRYLNFGDTAGETGYGIRDNGGVLQFKNSAGTWVDFGSGGSGSGDMTKAVYDTNDDGVVDSAEMLKADTTRTGDVSLGEMAWDNDKETFVMGIDGASVSVNQNFWYVRNNTGSTLVKGTPVYASGAIGASGRITVAPMIADGSIESRYLLGVLLTDVSNGADGLAISTGTIRQLDTSAWADGTVLYVDPNTAGLFTATEPTAPGLSLPIAFVVHSSATAGEIAVRVSSLDENAYALNEDLGALAFLDTVDSTQINDNAVTNTKIANNSVSVGKIANSAVQTNKIADANVTLAKLEASVQTSLGKADSAIQAADLATVATSGDYNDLSNLPDLTVFDNLENYANEAAFPATGSLDKLYLAEDTGELFRWTGSAYVGVSTDHAQVTLAGTPDYITIIGQTITRSLINLASHVTGRLPFANLSTLSAHQVLGRAGSGTGDAAGITMGNDTILGREGSGNIDALSASQVRTITETETTTQLNARDTANRDRANHTGTQAASTISDFAATVRATILTGISFATSTAVTASDSILTAIGKLQAQNTAQDTAIAGKANTSHTHALSDLTASGATTGQVATYNGTNWVPQDPSGGGGDTSFERLDFSVQTAPATPAADTFTVYMTGSGTSPNRTLEWKMKNEDGEEVILTTLVT